MKRYAIEFVILSAALVATLFTFPDSHAKATAAAQERLTLPAPIVRGNVTDFHIRTIDFDLGRQNTTDDDAVTVVLEADGSNLDAVSLLQAGPDVVRRFVWSGIVANNIIKAVNTANMANRSLASRVMDRIVADNLMSGTVGGAPLAAPAEPARGRGRQ
jgi:hypothetical protein